MQYAETADFAIWRTCGIVAGVIFHLDIAMPLVSVIVPAYNGADYLPDSIGSILGQTFRDFELIVVDDASTDETEKIVPAFDDPRIRYVRHPENQGVAAATRTGFEASDSKYVALLDQDDIALADRLETQVRLFNGQPRLGFAGGFMEVFGDTQGISKVPLADGEIKANLLAGMMNLLNPTVMLRRDFLDKHGLRWQSAHASVFDWGLYASAMLKGARFANVPKMLTRYRSHAAQQSKDRSGLRETIAAIRLGIMKSFFPRFSEAQCRLLEPLLEWIQPPPMKAADIRAALALVPEAMAQTKSACGEDRKVVNRFLAACRDRWQQALG